MFNRSRNPREAAAAATIDDVLADLQSPAGAPAPTAPSAATGAPSAAPGTAPDPTGQAAPGTSTGAGAADHVDHTATLRATRDAQQQAQEMLALASQTRTTATEQAEQIVVEARDAAERMRADAARDAERIRRDAADWVVTQRARVETAVTEATDAAAKDAEDIRSEAMRSAMAEAEQTARLYIGEAAARGARDADLIRGQARDVLAQASELATDLQTAVRDLAEALARTSTTADEKLAAIDALIAQAQAPEISQLGLPDLPPPPRPADPLDPSTTWESDEAPAAPAAPVEQQDGPAPSGRELGAMFRGNGGGA